MDKMTKKIIGAFLIMVAVAALILAGYYMLSKKETPATHETVSLPSTEIEKLKAKNLELKYPGTPSEVVKLYWRLNKCIYNTEMSDEDLEALLKQLRLLYDEELLSQTENSSKNMFKMLKADKKEFNKMKRLISSYTVESERDVKYAKLEGKECATLITSTLESVSSKNTMTYEKFICREDNNGKWKILGWEKTSNSEEK